MDTLELAKQAARAAGATILACQGTARVNEKTSTELVTEADLLAEQVIRDMIAAQRPNDAFYGEESAARPSLDAPSVWVVDPLDGTHNFANGIPQFAVSIAHATGGIVQVGVVYDPVRGEMFSAQRGQGAWLNEQPIRVGDKRTLNECIIATGFAYDRGVLMERTLDSVRSLFHSGIRGIRRFGSAALDLCFVACGRFDAYFEYSLCTWDHAAGALIVAEAGGAVTDHFGSPYGLSSTGAIAANQPLLTPVTDIVRYPADRATSR